MPVCTTTTCAAPAVAEAEAVVVGLGGTEDDGLADGLVAAAVGVGVGLGLVVVVDLLLHAERKAIVAAQNRDPVLASFTRPTRRTGLAEVMLATLADAHRRCSGAWSSLSTLHGEHPQLLRSGNLIWTLASSQARSARGRQPDLTGNDFAQALGQLHVL